MAFDKHNKQGAGFIKLAQRSSATELFVGKRTTEFLLRKVKYNIEALYEIHI